MPLTEGPAVDQRTEDVLWLVDFVRGDDSAYRQLADQRAAEAAEAEAEAKEKAIWRLAHPRGRPQKRKPGSRPWQAAGYNKKADWEAALAESGVEPPPFPQTRRERVESRIRSRKR